MCIKYDGGVILGADARSATVYINSKLTKYLRTCMWATVCQINLSLSIRESTANVQVPVLTLVQSLVMLDTTWTSRLQSSEDFQQ